MKTTTFFLATVSMFNSNKAKEDKNGLMPLILVPIAGSCPLKRVLSGTIAQNMNIEEGETYLFTYTMQESEDYGLEPVYTRLNKVEDPLLMIDMQTKLGPASVQSE